MNCSFQHAQTFDADYNYALQYNSLPQNEDLASDFSLQGGLVESSDGCTLCDGIDTAVNSIPNTPVRSKQKILNSVNNNLLSFEYFNARSVKNKLPDLHYVIYNENTPLITIITESWLNETVSDSMADQKGYYNILRSDRKNGITGGGVAVLISKHLNIQRISISDEFSMQECVCFDFINSNTLMHRVI